MTVENLKIGELNIDLIRKNIKNMHLAVYPPTGRVRLAVPTNTPDETIRLFVVAKIGWIRKHQRNFMAQDRLTPREYKARESHYFQGRRYLLNIIEEDAPPKVVLNSKTYINLHVRPNSSSEQRQSILNEWYRKELKQLLPSIIEKWSPIIGVTVEEWQVKQMKTKWGTCNISKKRIWLNLELAKKPLHCLEYVVVHEMVHLLERYHNERFYAFMTKFMPQWKFYKDELNHSPLSHEDWSE
jgi:predicted metal-dependent hydrolase